MDTSLTANEMAARDAAARPARGHRHGAGRQRDRLHRCKALVLRALIPELAIILVLTLIIAGVCATRWRWAPHLVVLWAVLSVIPGLEPYWYDPTHPAETGNAGRGSHRPGHVSLSLSWRASLRSALARPPSPPGIRPAGSGASLRGTATFVLGASLVATIPTPNAGVSAEALAQLPALVAGRYTFDQAKLRARVGETIALRLENTDTMVHSFDIDAFDVHVSLPTSTPALAIFTATTPGSYTFYCRTPATPRPA